MWKEDGSILNLHLKTILLGPESPFCHKEFALFSFYEGIQDPWAFELVRIINSDCAWEK